MHFGPPGFDEFSTKPRFLGGHFSRKIGFFSKFPKNRENLQKKVTFFRDFFKNRHLRPIFLPFFEVFFEGVPKNVKKTSILTPYFGAETLCKPQILAIFGTKFCKNSFFIFKIYNRK